MYKSKVIKFVSIFTLLIISRAYDFIATYIYTPDLTNETNVLVKFFNFNYLGLLIFQFILIILIGYGFYIYIFNKYKVSPSSAVNNVREFISYFHFGKPVPLSYFLYKTPKKNSILYSIGYIVTYSLICIGFIVGTSTVFLINSEKYKLFYSEYGSLTLYSILIIIVLYFSYSFYKNEYNKYLKSFN